MLPDIQEANSLSRVLPWGVTSESCMQLLQACNYKCIKMLTRSGCAIGLHLALCNDDVWLLSISSTGPVHCVPWLQDMKWHSNWQHSCSMQLPNNGKRGKMAWLCLLLLQQLTQPVHASFIRANPKYSTPSDVQKKLDTLQHQHVRKAECLFNFSNWLLSNLSRLVPGSQTRQPIAIMQVLLFKCMSSLVQLSCKLVCCKQPTFGLITYAGMQHEGRWMVHSQW